MPFMVYLFHFISFFFFLGFFWLFVVMWLTAPPVQKSPPSWNWVSLLFLNKPHTILYTIENSIYLFIYIYINRYSHNECSELNISNSQNQNSDLQKRKKKKDGTVSSFLTDCCFYLFAFSFTLRCLHWKRSRFLTRACDSSLQYCKCLRIEPMGWAAIFVSRKMAQT